MKVEAHEAHDEGVALAQGHQRRGADGETLADGRSGAARGAHGTEAVAHVRGEPRHLRDAAGVVGDRAEPLVARPVARAERMPRAARAMPYRSHKENAT